MKLDGIEAFVATAATGSISAAARQLGHAKSVVSERLSELERAIGACLIQRTTRRLTLTEDGDRFLPRARRILQEARDARSEVAERNGKLSGNLRISAPVGFGYLHLGPALYQFLARHPGISLSLDLDDRFVDVAADGYDAVIRHGPVADVRIVAKRIATTHRLLVASPNYIARNGSPRSIAELGTHQAILYSMREADWRFRGKQGWTVVRPSSCLRVNNGLVMRDAALAGLGITLLPNFFVQKEVEAGDLAIVDVGAEAEGAELLVCYSLARNASTKVAMLIEWLRNWYGDPPYWDRGQQDGAPLLSQAGRP